jgi:putative oxidoreductase
VGHYELTIPILRFAGLATRVATVPLLGMILIIQTFVYPNAYNDHLTWGSILLLLLTRGPGVLSLDYLIDKYFAPGWRAKSASLHRGPAGT